MPIYEYRCQKCGYKFEKLVFNKEKIKCPRCGSENPKKLFSSFAVSKKSNNSSSCEEEVCNLDCPSCEN